ncbi:MAG: hypothetical protein K2J79_00445 [Ruminiclostridium sp.]|nr:hypothetical protein [Ruminiclostridium sp.]
MKKLFCVFIVFFTISLSACSLQTEELGQEKKTDVEQNTAVSNSTATDTEPVSQFPLRDINFPSLEEVQEKYPDKTVLVWVIQETGYERNYPFRTKEVNEYLDSQGNDFAVCFYPIEALVTDKQNDFYTDYVKDMVKRGEQADIIYSSYTYIEEGGSNAYYKDVYNGLFEPLDKYFDTDIGQRLYDLMPEKHWDGLRVGGSIYGIDGTMLTLSDDYGYYVNAELADKYGFDTAKSVEEQLDILKRVKKEENCDVFAMSGDKIGTASCFADIKEITGAVYWNDETHTAECVLDNAQYVDRLKFLYEVKKEGLFTNINNKNLKIFFIFQDNKAGVSTVYNSEQITEIDYFDNKIQAYPVFKEPTSVRSSYMATGICTASKNKEKAFELLALTQTDPYLNNLLTFGLEGTDYTLVEDKVDTIVNYISIVRFPNKMICNQYDNSFSAEDYIKIYDNAAVHSDTDFAFDARGLINETFDTSLIMMNFSLPDSDKSFEEVISDLRSSLEEAGLQKIIDECNRQYNEVYLKGNNLK